MSEKRAKQAGELRSLVALANISGGSGPGVFSIITPQQFGAKGDGVNNDTAAFQAAINAAQGAGLGRARMLLIPHGIYRVVAPLNAPALAITGTIQMFGESLEGSTILVDGPGSGLLVESGAGFNADYTILHAFSMEGVSVGGNLPIDFVVVHAAGVSITNISFANSARCSVLIESGTTPLLGVSLVPSGTYIDSDQWEMDGVFANTAPSAFGQMTTTTASFVQPAVGAAVTVAVANSNYLNGMPVALGANSVGAGGGVYTATTLSPTSVSLVNLGNAHGYTVGATVPEGLSVQPGAMLMIHGSDSQAGVATLVSGTDCSVTIYAGAIGSNLYQGCASQDANAGYISAAAAAATFVSCDTEDFDALVSLTPSTYIGGSLTSFAAGLLNGAATESVGNDAGAVNFRRVNVADGATYIANIPAAPQIPASIGLGRSSGGVETDYYLAYQFDGLTTYPYLVGSFIWRHFRTGGIDKDLFGGPFGWTDTENANGAALGLIAAPLLNAQRRWTFEQTGLALAGGLQTIYLNGGATDAGGFAFGDSGTQYWANNKTRVTVSVRFDNVTDMAAAGVVTVCGTVTIAESGTLQNFAVSINAQNSVAAGKATLVWQIEQYVQNYASGTGNPNGIG
jgi:Pectate lyase superfamily protein